jgi:Flp pilus assembly protein TadG
MPEYDTDGLCASRQVAPIPAESAESDTAADRWEAGAVDERHKSVHRHRRGDRGASLVEFALVVPLLTLFVFGIVQFGLAYDMKQSINSAAREGARMAAIPDEDNVTYGTIRARVDSSFASLASGTVDDVEVQVVRAANPSAILRTCTGSGCTPATTPPAASPCSGLPGETVVVTVTERHDITIPFYGVRRVDLVGRGEFRCEIDA